MIESAKALSLMLKGKSLDLFNNVVREYEARLADERKRADDAVESLNNVRRDFPQQSAKSFSTEIGTKG